MKFSRRRMVVATGALLLAGCAGVQPGFEQPSVTLSSFRAVPAGGMLPRFAIGLRVVNPNRSALRLRGLTYDIEMEGHTLITGVTSDLPTVPGYGEADIEVLAGVDLLGGVRLLTGLLNDAQRDTVRYALRARLDVGGLNPIVTLSESGEIALAPARR